MMQCLLVPGLAGATTPVAQFGLGPGIAKRILNLFRAGYYESERRVPANTMVETAYLLPEAQDWVVGRTGGG